MAQFRRALRLTLGKKTELDIICGVCAVDDEGAAMVKDRCVDD